MSWGNLVVPSKKHDENDVEASLLSDNAQSFTEHFLEEEPTCFGLPVCSEVMACVEHYFDVVTELFNDTIYGEDGDREKET